jgi:O-antigen biosynthesis protein WbqP
MALRTNTAAQAKPDPVLDSPHAGAAEFLDAAPVGNGLSRPVAFAGREVAKLDRGVVLDGGALRRAPLTPPTARVFDPNAFKPENLNPKQRARRASGLFLGAKRLIDIAVALVGLLVSFPVVAVLWVMVRATSEGPGVHWSKRVGLHGRTFYMPKLRTMVKDAPVMAREALLLGEDATTPLGRVLRARSLDELPQFWSILVGDMSLIGPRPLLSNDPASAERMDFPAALGVRPGLTGLAQIRGRNLVAPRRKARYDGFYAKHFGWRMDWWVFLQTVDALFRRKGGGVL